MTLIVLITFAFLLFSHYSLSKRVQKLENRLQSDQERGAAMAKPSAEAPQTMPVGEFAPVAPPPLVTRPVAVASTPAQPDSGSPIPFPYQPAAAAHSTIPQAQVPAAEETEFFLYRWFQEQTLIKVGAIIFFLGAAWFVGYAIEQNWLSPLTRIVLGVLGAYGLYALGHWRSTKALVQYQVLTVLGTGVLLGTIAASQLTFASPVLPGALALSLMVSGVGYCTLVALITKTEWLAIAAVVAGLLAPALIASDTPNVFLLLSYLFCMSIGFLLAAYTTVWRSMVLVLILGVSFYLSGAHGNIADMTLWIFVCLFSALFTASVSTSVVRLGRPALADVSALGVILLVFLLAANEMAFSTAAAQFAAAAVAAGVAYLLRERNASVDAVSLYALISVVLIFMATSNLFSGVTLTIIFAIEALVLVIGSCFVATVKRSVYVAAATFLLPLLSGLADLDSTIWNEGIWHIGLFSVLILLITLGTAMVWLIEQSSLRQLAWVRTIAATLLGAWFFYMWVAVGTISEAVSMNTTTSFTLWSIIATLLVTMYVGLRVPDGNWRTWILLTWLPPVTVGLGVLFESAWQNGLAHSAFAVTTGVVFILFGLTAFYAVIAKHLPLHTRDTSNSHATLWIAIGYLFFWLYAVWYALYPDQIAYVALYVSYFIVVSMVVYVLLLLRVRFGRILGILSLGVIPLFLSLPSFELAGWSDGILGLHALGVYASTTLIFMLAQSLATYQGLPEEVETVNKTRRVLFWIGGLQIFATVWIATHTIATTGATAVATALFIYTIAGLAAYSYGRATDRVALKRVGALLLGAVVLRLGLVDVWTMEIIWRIITFLSIGTLFILTALLERPDHTTKQPGAIPNAPE